VGKFSSVFAMELGSIERITTGDGVGDGVGDGLIDGNGGEGVAVGVEFVLD